MSCGSILEERMAAVIGGVRRAPWQAGSGMNPQWEINPIIPMQIGERFPANLLSD
jgi:hypothetical protein